MKLLTAELSLKSAYLKNVSEIMEHKVSQLALALLAVSCVLCVTCCMMPCRAGY